MAKRTGSDVATVLYEQHSRTDAPADGHWAWLGPPVILHRMLRDGTQTEELLHEFIAECVVSRIPEAEPHTARAHVERGWRPRLKSLFRRADTRLLIVPSAAGCVC